MSTVNKRSSKEEVINHIKTVMGMVPPEGATKDELYAFIEENGGTVGAGDSGDTGESRNTSIDQQSGIDMNKRVKIRIAKTEDDQDDVFVGLNGAGFQIKRGVAVEVPEALVGVLRDATTKKLREKIDGNGNHTGTFEYIDVQSYPVETIA